MVIRCLHEVELREDVRDVALDGLVGEPELSADRSVRAALGDEAQHLALTGSGAARGPEHDAGSRGP